MLFGRCNYIKTWNEWDNSVHAEQSQIDRQGRAMTYPFDFDIDYEHLTARFSSTSELPYYDTSLSRCTCYDFSSRHLPCKHIYRLAVELGVIEIVKRPAGGYDKTEIKEIKDSKDIDANPEQIKRIERAKENKCAPIKIDFESRTALFQGSGKSPYETTESSCTCRDFFIRRLPCKHIYRLRMEIEGK